MISLITIAKGFLILGALAAVVGLLGGLLLVVAWVNDKWQRRDRRPLSQIPDPKP